MVDNVGFPYLKFFSQTLPTDVDPDTMDPNSKAKRRGCLKIKPRHHTV